MTSSTKPEVHNVSKSRPCRGEPSHGHNQFNMHKNLVFRPGVIEIGLCEQTNKQTCSSQYFASLSGEVVINYSS